MKIVEKKSVFTSDNEEIKRVGLTVNKDVKKASFIDLLARYLKDTITGNIKSFS